MPDNVDNYVSYLTEGVITNEVKSYLQGVDDKVLEKAKSAAKNGKPMTLVEKNKILEEIDDAIDNSNRIFTPPTFLKGLVSNISGLGGILYVVTRACSSSNRKVYREALYDARSVIKAIPTKG